jgi:hypothetical protein
MPLSSFMSCVIKLFRKFSKVGIGSGVKYDFLGPRRLLCCQAEGKTTEYHSDQTCILGGNTKIESEFHTNYRGNVCSESEECISSNQVQQTDQ